MFKKIFFIILLTLFLGLNANVFAADTEVVLGSSDATSGFTVKDSSNKTVLRAGGDGNVGIGTTSPSGAKLHILQDSSTPGADMQIRFGGQSAFGFRGYNDGSFNYLLLDRNYGGWQSVPAITFRADGNVGIGTMDTRGYKLWVKGASGQTNLLNLFTTNDSGVNLSFYYSDPNNQYVIRSTAASGLRVDSNLYVTGAAYSNSVYNNSSLEYKENIRKVDAFKQAVMLDKLMKLNINTYNYKEEFGGDGLTKIGFIAEEMPEAVLSKDGKAVDVYELLTYTIGAMKEQQKMIKTTVDAMKEQQELISILSSKVENLEDQIH